MSSSDWNTVQQPPRYTVNDWTRHTVWGIGISSTGRTELTCEYCIEPRRHHRERHKIKERNDTSILTQDSTLTPITLQGETKISVAEKVPS